MGAVFLIAFASLGVQITGLVGTHGLLPIHPLLDHAHSVYGARAYYLFPTLAWISDGDRVLALLCWGGAVLSVMPLLGRAPAAVFALLWTLYLSITVVGQVFLEFQWDALLLEAGLLACLYAPWTTKLRASGEPNPVVRWVVWSLAFKLTFLSGITKILSGDPTWAHWTALTYHYETQPIPAWTSWYVYQLPTAVHHWSVPTMLGVELVAPLAIFLPARFQRTRYVACLAMSLLQVGIGVTGNYGFFNLLTIVLYLALLDDQLLRRLFAPFVRRGASGVWNAGTTGTVDDPKVWRASAGTLAGVIAILSACSLAREIELTAGTTVQVEGAWGRSALELVSPFRFVNGYGLFRVMTTERPEIVLEVSADRQVWREYEFRWKPGDPMRRPSFVEPYMPRLDWQMWFAALNPRGAQDWLGGLLRQVLMGEPTVLRLLASNPLAGHPRFARLAYYDYRFTTRAERAATGAWWKRELRGYLTDPISAP
jgi:hypothetical protein